MPNLPSIALLVLLASNNTPSINATQDAFDSFMESKFIFKSLNTDANLPAQSFNFDEGIIGSFARTDTAKAYLEKTKNETKETEKPNNIFIVGIENFICKIDNNGNIKISINKDGKIINEQYEPLEKYIKNYYSIDGSLHNLATDGYEELYEKHITVDAVTFTHNNQTIGIRFSDAVIVPNYAVDEFYENYNDPRKTNEENAGLQIRADNKTITSYIKNITDEADPHLFLTNFKANKKYILQQCISDFLQSIKNIPAEDLYKYNQINHTDFLSTPPNNSNSIEDILRSAQKETCNTY